MDLKYALRSLLKNPGFTALAVIVMALGIGANTAVFSVVNAVLLRPLAYKNPDRIVSLSPLWKKSGKSGGPSSAPDFYDWRDQSTAFDAMAYYVQGRTPLELGSTAEFGFIGLVSPDFFKVFQVSPILGRGFSDEEWKSGEAVVIGYSFWQSHFGGSREVIGRTVRHVGKSFTIIGVMPPGFRFPGESDAWIPLNGLLKESQVRGGHHYMVVGRLKPGVTIAQARAQMTLIADRLEKQYADDRNKGVAVIGMRDLLVRDVRATLYLLLGAVGVVLLVACANIANLLLARAIGRSREMAIRAAVGATRARIMRQLIAESMALSLAAGAAGLLVAIWGSKALIAVAPEDIPRLAETGVDRLVLGFTLGISIIASLIFGLVPALAASRVDLNDALKSGTRSVIGGSARLRSALVVAEIAFSVVLLAAAGLLVRSFVALNAVALGFQPEHVLIMESFVPVQGLDQARGANQFYKELLDDIRRLPSVRVAGGMQAPPGTERFEGEGGYWIDKAEKQTAVASVYTVIMPKTLETLGIPLVSGRDFDDTDAYNAPFTAIINESLAKKSFPGQNPIGHIISCGLDGPGTLMKIVGVAGNVRQHGPAQEPWPEIYMPYLQHPFFATYFNVLVRSDDGSLPEVLRRMVRARRSDVPVRFSTMDASLAKNVAAPRFRTLIFVVFAILAVALAMAGVYGVMAYVVGQRLNEIGLRMALGASQGDVLRMVLKQGLTLAALGVVLGLAGALAATRLLASFLFAVKPQDPLTYAGVALLLGVVAMAACYVPARRATQVDPLAALREE